MRSMTRTFQLDATGEECPIPVLRTKKALRKLTSGDILEVRCTDPMAEIDIPALLFKTGDLLIAKEATDGIITMQIRKF
jgi:tRNA 2-thiouridine synthesizing protein A